MAGLCGVHFPKPEKPSAIDTIKNVAAVAGTVVSVLTILEKLIKLWQQLPFGPGPAMPEDYKYLASVLGSAWGTFPTTYRPFQKSESSVNWELARSIYDQNNQLLSNPPKTESERSQQAALIDEKVEELINTMDADFQSMFMQSLKDS